MILPLALIGAGAALSLAALVSEFRRSRLTEPYAGLPRIPPEIQFVAAALTAAGAGLGWGRDAAVLTGIGHAVVGMFIAVKLRG